MNVYVELSKSSPKETSYPYFVPASEIPASEIMDIEIAFREARNAQFMLGRSLSSAMAYSDIFHKMNCASMDYIKNSLSDKLCDYLNKTRNNLRRPEEFNPLLNQAAEAFMKTMTNLRDIQMQNALRVIDEESILALRINISHDYPSVSNDQFFMGELMIDDDIARHTLAFRLTEHKLGRIIISDIVNLTVPIKSNELPMISLIISNTFEAEEIIRIKNHEDRLFRVPDMTNNITPQPVNVNVILSIDVQLADQGWITIIPYGRAPVVMSPGESTRIKIDDILSNT